MFRNAINTFMTLCGFSLLALLGLASASHAAENNTIDRYVIAISANNGGKGRPMLRYAESDAKSFANVLKDMGGVKQQNLILIQEPSVSFLNSRMDDLDKIISANKGKNGREEILVYYSGHADEKGLRLGNEVYAWSEFRKRVDALSADVKIAVIDACGSGAITRAKGGVAVPAFMMDQSSDMKGYAFITSSTQDESSQESDKLKGSFFTHSLVSGLRGAGDLSGDGKVTLSEAYQFAFNETLQKTQSTMGGAQHPSRDMNLAGTGDVVMTDLRSMGAGVTFDEYLEGRLFIRDEKGSLVAELYKAAGRNMSLGLPAGNYELHLERSAAHKAANITLSNGKIENVALAQFKDVKAEKTVARGEIKSERTCAAGDPVMCSLDSLDHNASFRTTFNAVDHEKEPRKGLQIGVFASIADDYMIGSQLSLIANVAKKEMHGIQVSSVVNVAKDHMEGAQVGSTLNYARSFDGVQVAPFNIAARKSEGVQIGNINVAADTLSAVQIGAINYAGYTPVQISAINVAGGANVQVSAINVTGGLFGPQVGAINYAHKAEGRQWGVINICAECEKTPIGLINIVGNGVWSLTGTFNEMGGTAYKVDLGTAYYYISWESSRNFEKGHLFGRYDDVWESGLGIGTHFGKYGSHFELEYMFLNVADKVVGGYGTPAEDADASFHHRLRFGSTWEIIRGIGLTGGLSLNLLTEGFGDSLPLKPRGDYHEDVSAKGHEGRIWPGFYAGLTVGRF
ncbi:caspase family protein [Fibrobacter sp. UWEL]|uniref:caspase family protein n=1 Tax=Fibrobacter sp. UWEL TaxID=1896209 RepID=UPI000911381D|nr:caspase family protein [Fibrobacter sp. UWEL]SHK86339.1 Caspase domain-containing protein [Fibrobacter sp. UWEL]